MKLATRHKIALARLIQPLATLPQRLAGRGEAALVRRMGLNWCLDLNEGIDFAIYLLGGFEKETVRRYGRLVSPGDTVLDIGANIGAHTLPLARAVGPQGRVIAFEPTRRMFAKLQANIARNPDLAARITCHQTMLVEQDAARPDAAVVASWPVGGAPPGVNDHGARLESTEGADAVSLDSFLRRQEIGDVAFIKLDVDGHEPAVLAGATGTLRRRKPVIILELAPYELARAGRSLDQVIMPLHGAGYRLFTLASEAPLPDTAEAILSHIPRDGGINAIARPAPARPDPTTPDKT